MPGEGPAMIAGVFLLPAEVPYGSLVCHVAVTDSRLGSAQLLVTIVNGEATGHKGQFAVTDASLSFTPGNPTNQRLCLLNLGATTAVSYTATAMVTSGPDWLQITPAEGTVPAGTFNCATSTVEVQVVHAGLAPGVYHGAVTITPTNLGDAAPLVVDVSFTVGGKTPLQVARASLPVGTGGYVNFNYQIGKSVPPPQTLSILSGGVKPIAFSAKLYPGSPWLAIEPSGIAVSTPAGITMKLTPAALTLPAGGYYATIHVSAPEASNPESAIPVALFISQGPMVTIGTPPTTINFQTGGPNPPSQPITVTTTGDPVTFNVSTVTPWLSVSPTEGTASATSPQTLTISVNAAGMDPGTYMGSIDVSNTVVSEGSTTDYNDMVPVTLNVSSNPQLNSAPSALSFSFQTQKKPPAPQTINLSSTVRTLPFTVTASAMCGTGRLGLQPWFTVSPSHGVTEGAAGLPITVSVDPAAVTSEETCTGLVTIAAAGAANTIQIPVTLNALASH